MKKASNMWRDWKARLKFDYFIDNRNDPQTLAIVPPRVVPDQWRTLVQYWSTEAAEVNKFCVQSFINICIYI